MKKHLIILSAGLVALLLLASCTDKDEQPSLDPQPSASESGVQPSASTDDTQPSGSESGEIPSNGEDPTETPSESATYPEPSITWRGDEIFRDFEGYREFVESSDLIPENFIPYERIAEFGNFESMVFDQRDEAHYYYSLEWNDHKEIEIYIAHISTISDPTVVDMDSYLAYAVDRGIMYPPRRVVHVDTPPQAGFLSDTENTSRMVNYQGVHYQYTSALDRLDYVWFFVGDKVVTISILGGFKSSDPLEGDDIMTRILRGDFDPQEIDAYFGTDGGAASD